MIRLARSSDAEAIAAVHIQSWRESYRGIVPDDYLERLDPVQRRTEWQDSLASGIPETWVAEQDAAIVGWVSFGPRREAATAEDAAEIWALYVLRSHWGRQLGAGLLERACERLTERGFATVCLWVFARNERARRFYSGAGFVALAGSAQQFTLGGEVIDEICYTRDLGAPPAAARP